MPTELNLRFPDAEHVIVRLGADDDGSGQLAFTNPITAQNLLELQWYYCPSASDHGVSQPRASSSTARAAASRNA